MAMASQKHETEGLHQSFGLWSAISLGWLTLNVFGGMSFIIFFGLSAGGIPAILYGFIGSCLAVTCIILTFAQCASRFSTAGGAYHYACFLVPDKYRRQIAYPLGWLNWLGWIFTHAGCCAIVANLTLGLVNLCRPDFDVSTRWQLFLVYLAIVATCWLINLWGLKGIPTLEILGCYVTAFGFIAYTIALLVKAPKASPSFVFVETHNSTGYSSTSFAILLGLFSSFSTLMGLDGPAHLAEEIPQPKRHLPRVMLIVIISQTVIGVVWILVLGFSITDMDLVVQTKTGIPVLELIRLATGSDASAMVLCITLLINNSTSALGSAVTMSRQGYAFARDGGLIWNAKLTELSPGSHLPLWSINLPSLIVALVGIIYLFSNAAFNALVGAQATCMIISFGFPALVLLVTDGKLLPANNHWNYGVFSKPIYVVSVGYSILVVIVSALPQSHPVTSLNMNYTVLVMGGFSIVMGLAWVTEGRKLFKPPVNDESLVKTNDVIIGVNVDLEADEQASKGKDATGSSGHDKNQSLIVTEA